MEGVVNCDTDQFSKLWELHEMFEVNQIRMFGKYVNVPRKQGLFSDQYLSYNFSGCTLNSLKTPDLHILSECQEKIIHIDLIPMMPCFSIGTKMGMTTFVHTETMRKTSSRLRPLQVSVLVQPAIFELETIKQKR